VNGNHSAVKQFFPAVCLAAGYLLVSLVNPTSFGDNSGNGE